MSTGRVAMLAVVLGLGCQMDNPAFDDPQAEGGASSTVADTKPGEGGSMDAGDGDPNTGDGDPNTSDGDPNTGDGDPNTGDGDPNTGDGDPSTGDGEPDGDGDPAGPGLCGTDIMFLDPGCADCIDPTCCPPLLSCVQDPDCGCITGCVLMGEAPMDCFDSCQPNPNGGLLAEQALMCVTLNCGNLCGLAP